MSVERPADSAMIQGMASPLTLRPAYWARFWPLGPIFSMELRQVARRRRTYLLRLLYLGLMLAVLSMAYSVEIPSRYQVESLVQQAQRRAELGHLFLAVFALFSVVGMHLIAPVLTSSSIGAERLRRTLDVVLMTPMPAWQIVAGKLFSRSLTAFSLIGLTLPVLAIVRLLGGVPWEDMFGAVALAGAVAVGSASIGLLLSCFLRRAFAVILLAYLIQGAIYGLLPMVLTMIFFSRGPYGPGGAAYLQILSTTNPLFTATLRSVRSGALGVQWEPAIIGQLGLALVLTLITTALLRRESRAVRPITTPAVAPTLPVEAMKFRSDPPTAGSEMQSLPYQPMQDRGPLPKASPVLDNPVLWREVRRPLLARPWQRALAVGVTLALLGLCYLALIADRSLGDRQAQIPFAICMSGLIMLISIVLSATAIAAEKESDTWTTLIMSPLNGYAIVWGKFRGLIRRLRWPFVLMAVHFILFTLAGCITWQATFVVLFTTATFGLPWMATGMYLSLRCQRTTTAVVLNLVLPLMAYGLVPLVLATISNLTNPNSSREPAELVLYYLPFYYQGESIDRLRDYGNFGSLSLPYFNTSVSSLTIVWLAIAAGVVLTGLAALLLLAIGHSFDGIVGRAKSR